MHMGLGGKRALVVGASKGIGRAVALSLAAEGALVTTVARSGQLLEELDAELRGGQADAGHCFYQADLMSQSPAELAGRIIAEVGQVDIVVHCVGGSLGPRDPLSELAHWQHAWLFNAGTSIAMNSVLLPPMVERGTGRITHISSISAVMLRGNPLYAAAKAYLNAYVTTVGRALAPRGVVLSAIMPGAVSFPGSYWDRYQQSEDPRCHDFLSHHQAIMRFGDPQEIADAVTFMVSERASFMPAALIAVDGANM